MRRHIAVLGLGEAGSEIARDLVAAGADVRGYDPKVPQVEGVERRAGEADAVRDADVVLSVNSSHDAMSALENALPAIRAGTMWADLNTASSHLKAALEQAVGAPGGRRIVALMAPVPGKGLHTPMLVSGPAAGQYAEITTDLGADVTVQLGPVGEAISRKLLRSVFYKARRLPRARPPVPRGRGLCAEWLSGNISAEMAGFDDPHDQPAP